MKYANCSTEISTVIAYFNFFFRQMHPFLYHVEDGVFPDVEHNFAHISHI